MLKAAVRNILNRVVTRERFNDSLIYNIYLSVFRRQAAEQRRQEFRFYDSVVGRDRLLIFDIGANAGHKANIFRQLAKRVVCVEPTPSAIESLRRRFRYESRVNIVPKGAGDSEKSCQFHVFNEVGAYNTVSTKLVEALRTASFDFCVPQLAPAQSITIEMTTLDALIRQFGRPYYVKIDVEGHEVAVIRGLSEAIPLVSFECNLPEFTEETMECIGRLSRIAMDATFQYVITEPPVAFESKRWMSPTELTETIRHGRLGYMEIFCRSS
jgi:FkbM family methyltransferase